MYSALRASWISGLAVGAISIGYDLYRFATLSGTGLEDSGTVSLAASVTFVVLAVVITGEVRLGLYLSKCQTLSKAAALAIPGILLALLAIYHAVPIKAHAVHLDLPAPGTPNPWPPLLPTLFSLAVAITPGVVAYVVGMAQRSKHGVA
jgi:hypothetical protein